MTSVPYPTFIGKPPVDNNSALVAVGTCRIHPESCGGASALEKYRAVVNKCIEQATVNQNEATPDDAKKLMKKYMKQGVAMAKDYLMVTLELDVSIVNVELLVTPADVMSSDGCLAACLLDAGCHAIVIDGNHLEAMDMAKIPRERLVAHFGRGCEETKIVAAAALASTVSVECVEPTPSKPALVSLLQMAAVEQQSLKFQIVVQLSCEGYSNDNELATLVGDTLKECKDGHGTITLVDPTASQLGLSYASCMKTDRPDGLFTTVVCTRAGEALGLVYSSKASVVAALECGRGVYFSRSRNGLWRKGDTSGHFQTLHRLDLDCDGDALRFTVTQRGDDCAAFCHLGTLTCWGEPRGLRHLERTLQDRLISAPAGSYTKRLFEEEDLLRDKLVEEAQELSEAQEPQHVAEELADVLYFAMTRAAKAGVSIDDAVAELDRRSRKVTRRKGDRKAFRIAAGQDILSKKGGLGGSS